MDGAESDVLAFYLTGCLNSESGVINYLESHTARLADDEMTSFGVE